MLESNSATVSIAKRDISVFQSVISNIESNLREKRLCKIPHVLPRSEYLSRLVLVSSFA